MLSVRYTIGALLLFLDVGVVNASTTDESTPGTGTEGQFSSMPNLCQTETVPTSGCNLPYLFYPTNSLSDQMLTYDNLFGDFALFGEVEI